MTGRRDELLKRADDLLRGTRWEPELTEIKDELLRREQAQPSDAGDDMTRLWASINAILNSPDLSFEDVVQRLMDLVIRCLHAERGVVFLLDERNRFKAIAQVNVESQCVADAMEYSHNILRRAAEDHVLWSGDALHDRRFSQYESIAAFNIKSFVCVPMKWRGKIIGTIYVDNRSLESTFKEKDLNFLRMVADSVASVAIENALQRDRLKAEVRELRTQIKHSIGERVIVGDDPKIKRILEIVDRVADSDATVLVRGESGTGKELIARAIHQASARLGQPLVTLNCAAIPESLLESELFGHMKGAFTGAHVNKIGKFEAADKGTLFLDEIGDMSFPLQAKILRALQEGVIEPVGSSKTHEVDVRIIAATNRNLAQMVEEGTFREDLFYRLNVIVLELPPLRERRGDIPKLVQHFLEKCTTSKTRAHEFSPEAMQMLQAYGWPGNIRELENLVMRVALLAPHEIVEPADVKPLLEGIALPSARLGAAATLTPSGTVVKLEDLERQAILTALAHCDGNRTAAAGALGISVRKLQYKIKEYQQAGIPVT